MVKLWGGVKFEKNFFSAIGLLRFANERCKSLMKTLLVLVVCFVVALGTLETLNIQIIFFFFFFVFFFGPNFFFTEVDFLLFQAQLVITL